MDLDWCQNFISIQYLENKLMDFDEILCMQYYADLVRIYHMQLNWLFTDFCPLINVKIMFRSTEFCPLMSKSCPSLMSENSWGLLPTVGQNGASGHPEQVDKYTQKTNIYVHWSRFVNDFILSDAIMTV